MESLFFAAFFFLILLPLVLGMTVPLYQNHKKVTAGILNYDPTMRKFVYKVSLSSEEMISLLETKNEMDALSCTFDFDRTILKFSEYGASKEYFYHIQESNGFSIFRLEQVSRLGMKSNIPYKLNPFMVKKLQAEIVPFSQYGF